MRRGRLAAHFEFLAGVEEIFDVQILHGMQHPYLAGPFAQADGRSPIWAVPQAAQEALRKGVEPGMAVTGTVEQPAVQQVPWGRREV